MIKIEVFLHPRNESIGYIRGVNLGMHELTGRGIILYVEVHPTHLISMPRVPKVKRVKSSYRQWRAVSTEARIFNSHEQGTVFTLRRNLRSSFDTSAESHNHPFQPLDVVDESNATEAGFSAIV